VKYLSVCSGIEAASVAWHHMGWEAVGYSEIEKFPSQLLEHHYPNVTNYGDMTKFKEWNINEPVNLLVGGTPCQSFSVAGLRKGLEDPRGNLMLTYLAMADHFKPKWLLWENVPGVLSSNGGNDFAALLQGMAELGYGVDTGFLTLNISECHKDAGVCSLSDVLETGEVQPKFYLSPKACAGILRRAETRGKKLPTALQKALQATVDSTQQVAKETL